MLPVELILLYMVYLGMGPGACKISRPLDAGFILFQFWVGLISVVPVPGWPQVNLITVL